MSHTYFIPKKGTPDDLASLHNAEEVAFTAISNHTHESLCKAFGWSRQFKNNETGEVIERAYHTTIWDTEPVRIIPDALLDAIEELPNHVYDTFEDALVELIDLAHVALDGNHPFIYIF